MKELVVCASGFGSNLQAIIEACKNKVIAAKIVLVASNNPNAFALKRAQKENIPTIHKKNTSELFACIKDKKPDLVILAGFMKIIPSNIVQEFKNKIINIHPSLLPAYPGLKSIERAYKNNENKTGVTIHYVDEGIDTGKIIMQEAIEIPKGLTLKALEKKVHQLEHKLYPKAIQNLLSNK